MDRLALWQTYVRVIETGSFSAVARELGTSQPASSSSAMGTRTLFGVEKA